MIVKYLKDGVWGYIDNVRQAASKSFDYEEMSRKYDFNKSNAICGSAEKDPVEYMDGVKLSDEIVTSNKAFMSVCADMEDVGINRHSENLLDITGVQNNFPASAILLYIEDCKEYDEVLLVTNQSTYLMNDKGQTIERLV
jgi:hypothetical protein